MWNKFYNYLGNKNVALFGNAKSVLNKIKEIDSKYDVICRINDGFPKDNEKFIGSRTDILFLSLPVSQRKLEPYNLRYIIWCTPKTTIKKGKNKEVSIWNTFKWLDRNSLKYELLYWQKLYDELKARPSTGVMSIDILLRANFKTLTLYGFDHWKSPTWYNNRIHLAKHNPIAEKKYIENKIQEYEGRIIYEKSNIN